MKAVTSSMCVAIWFWLFHFKHTQAQVDCTNPVYNRNYAWKTIAPINISCFNPLTESEISDSVRDVFNSSANMSIRGIGKSFSWSAVGMMENTVFGTNTSQTVIFVNQSAYRKNYTINDTSLQMTGQAGMSVLEVCQELEKHDLGLPAFGGIVVTNFVAAVNTGTHSKGSRKNAVKTMASQVVSFTIVLPNGTIVNLSKDGPNQDLFYAGLVSIGSMGIITDFTIQAIPFYNITRYEDAIYDNVSNTDYSLIETIVKQNISNLIDTYDFTWGRYLVFAEKFQLYVIRTFFLRLKTIITHECMRKKTY